MIYVASSWRNPMHTAVCAAMRAAGLQHYDFKADGGFHWGEVMLHERPTRTEAVPFEDYLKALEHPRSNQGYIRDFAAMQAAHTFVMVLPCGNSSHMELGWAVGQGKRTAIFSPGDEVIPDLMYKMTDHITNNLMDLLGWLGVVD